jgi:hypothetical protein
VNATDQTPTPLTNARKYYERHGQVYVVQAAYHAELERDLERVKAERDELNKAAERLGLAVHALYSKAASDDSIVIPGDIDDELRAAYEELNDTLTRYNQLKGKE